MSEYLNRQGLGNYLITADFNLMHVKRLSLGRLCKMTGVPGEVV